MPPHYWIVFFSSDPKQKRKELEKALGRDGKVVHAWKGSKKGRGYAVVSGAVEKIPKSKLVVKEPMLIEDDDDLEDVG
ncbi:MAG: hypothetical protein ACRDNC_09640 [Gaiellaceae bacterium]